MIFDKIITVQEKHIATSFPICHPQLTLKGMVVHHERGMILNGYFIDLIYLPFFVYYRRVARTVYDVL